MEQRELQYLGAVEGIHVKELAFGVLDAGLLAERTREVHAMIPEWLALVALQLVLSALAGLVSAVIAYTKAVRRRYEGARPAGPAPAQDMGAKPSVP